MHYTNIFHLRISYLKFCMKRVFQGYCSENMHDLFDNLGKF